MGALQLLDNCPGVQVLRVIMRNYDRCLKIVTELVIILFEITIIVPNRLAPEGPEHPFAEEFRSEHVLVMFLPPKYNCLLSTNGS